MLHIRLSPAWSPSRPLSSAADDMKTILDDTGPMGGRSADDPDRPVKILKYKNKSRF